MLRLTAPPDFGAVVLPAVIGAFARRHPAVRFDVRLGSNHVDLVKDGYDLAIRVTTGALKDSSLAMRRLGSSGAAFYASPAYVARRGRPREVCDPRHVWVLHAAAIRVLKLPADTAQFTVDDFSLARQLIRDGVGVGILPHFVARVDVQEGLLEEVPINTELLPGELVLLYPTNGQPPRKVTAFRDFLLESLRGQVLGP